MSDGSVRTPARVAAGVIAVRALLLALPTVLVTLAGTAVAARPEGIHKIQHVIVVMQENRSFDSYFGTYPGADGIPMSGGSPSVCIPSATPGTPCLRPYPDHADRNGGGPHSHVDGVSDIDHCQMDRVAVRYSAAQNNCSDPNDPACTHSNVPDVMGYHTQSDIPNYWAYAHNYVLQDHMFEPNSSWSLPQHLFMVSEWSARCTTHDVPAS